LNAIGFKELHDVGRRLSEGDLGAGERDDDLLRLRHHSTDETKGETLADGLHVGRGTFHLVGLQAGRQEAEPRRSAFGSSPTAHREAETAKAHRG